MESSRNSWTGSHRQLWTSSSDAGQRASGSNSFVDDLSADASTLPSASEWTDHDDTISMVMKECQESGGALLSSRAESGLASLLGAPGTENRVKSLVSVILATNARRRRDVQDRSKKDASKEAALEKLREVVGEITVRIRGEAPDKGEDVEDSLYRVLLDAEKCTELAQMVTKVSLPCLRDVLLESCGNLLARGAAPPMTEAERDAPSTAADRSGALEILDAHGYVDDSDDCDVAKAVLRAIKNIEELKREVSVRDVLLLQYEETVRRRLAIYGETRAPTVDGERARLTDSASSAEAAGAAATSAEQKPWWEERALRICDHLSRIPYHSTSETLPQAGPIDISFNAEATQASLADFLEATDASIVSLSREISVSKAVVVQLAEHLQSALLLPRDAADPNLLKQLPMSAALNRIAYDLAASLELASPENRPDTRKHLEESPNGAANRSDHDTKDDESLIPPTKLLALVVECIPTTIRAKFNLEKYGVFNEKRATQLLSAINFLNEHNRDTIHRIDDLCDRLRETFGMGGNGSNTARGLTLADQLSFLEDAVCAACRRSAEAVSSESSLTREVRQSIEELAQLLPIAESPPPPQLLSDNANIRVAPPTDDILQMTRILKLRLVDWQQSQAKRNAVGGRLRSEKARLEEAVKAFTTAAQPILTEMITGPTPHGEMDGSADASTDGAATAVAADVSQILVGVMASSDITLSDVLERLKMARARCARALQANSSLRARADSAAAQSKVSQRVTKRVADIVATICDSLGISTEPFGSKVGEGAESTADGRRTPREGGGGSSNEKGTYGKLNLRPDHPSLAGKSSLSSPPPASSQGGKGTAAGSGSGAARVAEEHIIDALQRIASRVAKDDALVKKSLSESELERLRVVEKRAEDDTVAYRQAIAMILTRLAEDGKMVKQSLYLLGTDESPKDDIVESVLRKAKSDPSKPQESSDNSDSEDEHESNERNLAALLQKYARWSRRLIETTEDHLDTQQKLVKYFAAVRRYFASQDINGADSKSGTASAASEVIMDENLIDIDTTLMRFADVILPALDRVLRHGTAPSSTSAAAAAAPADRGSVASRTPSSVPLSPGEPGDSDDFGGAEAPMGARPVEGLPYDHRLGRLYEMIGRLHTIMVSLLRVRYLSVPASVRQRSSGDTELLFDTDDCIDNGFVDLDLEKLVRVSVAARSEGEEAGAGGEPERFSREGKRGFGSPSDSRQASAAAPSARISANNDLIYRVATQNLDCVYQAMRKFSSSHKMAAILIQKDTDSVQERVAAMLEKYSELDIEQAFGQDRKELHSMYALLKERGTRQKGCYFFNRVNGEGDCVWARALEKLGDGFGGVIGKLVDRTTAIAKARELISDVVDLCAMYVNWREVAPLPFDCALPDDVLSGCIRDESDTHEAGGRARLLRGAENGSQTPSRQESLPTSGKLPPKPTAATGAQRTPAEVASAASADMSRESESGAASSGKLKVSYFVRDELVLKVLANMFQVAQAAAERGTQESEQVSQQQQQHLQQLEEELQLLQEAAGATVRRTAQLEQDKAAAEAEKNKALSEAAVARAELRRWKRLVGSKRAELEGDTPKRITAGSDADATSHSWRPDKDMGADSQTPLPSQSTVAASATGADAHQQQRPDYLQEMLQYMKALGEELHFANRVTGRFGNEGELAREGAVAPHNVLRGEGDDGVYDRGMTGADEGAIVAREAALRAREAQRLLQEQYGSTPLRIVAEPGRRGYASGIGSSTDRGAAASSVHVRHAASRSASTGPTSRVPRERFFADKTPLRPTSGGGRSADAYSMPHYLPSAAIDDPRDAGYGALLQRPMSRGGERRSHTPSSSSARRQTADAGDNAAYPRHQQRAVPRTSVGAGGSGGTGRSVAFGRVFTDSAPPSPQEAYFDADPLMPPPPVSSGRAWLQNDQRPRWRHSSPTAAVRAAPAGDRPFAFTDALETIRQGEAGDVLMGPPGAGRLQTPSANANVRTAALRRLADVVSKTKVPGAKDGRR